MRIKKTSETTAIQAEIVNAYNSSTTDGYSCNYINGIVESGSNSNGNYIKYIDGTMICYGRKTKSLAISVAWGALYGSGNGMFIFDNFAQPFITTPYITYSTNSTQSTCWAILDQDNPPSSTSPGGVQLMRATTVATTTINVDYIAIGKWK